MSKPNTQPGLTGVLIVFFLCLFVIVAGTHYMGLTQEAIDNRNWDEYRQVNGCKEVGFVPGTQHWVKGRTLTGPDKLVYRCAGGQMKERPILD